MSEYEAQANEFLNSNSMIMKVAFQGKKAPSCGDGDKAQHYRVTIRRIGGLSISFDFFGSIHDASIGKAPSAYDVLACISGDIHCPDTFADFCAEYGYNEDSRKDEALFRLALVFVRKMRGFFTPNEIEALGEIR